MGGGEGAVLYGIFGTLPGLYLLDAGKVPPFICGYYKCLQTLPRVPGCGGLLPCPRLRTSRLEGELYDFPPRPPPDTSTSYLLEPRGREMT